MLYTHKHTHIQIHLHIQAVYILTQWIKTSEDFFKKIYLSLYLKGWCVWEGVGVGTKTAIYWPPQHLRRSPCVVLVLLDCSTGGLRTQPLWVMFSSQHLLTNWSLTQSGVPKASSAVYWLSLPHLVSNSSDLQLNRRSQRPLLPGGGFLYHILSLTGLISNSLGVPRAPSAGWWLSLPNLVSN